MRTSRLFLSGVLAVVTGLALAPTHVATAAEGSAHVSAASRAGQPYEVTIRVSTTELVLGKRLTIRGTVSPKAVGKKVLLQKRIGTKSWHTEKKTTLNRKGKFTFTDKPSTVNPRKYRVVKPASKKHDRGVSPAVKVGVFQWHDVYNLDVRDQDSMYKTQTLSIDTVEYPRSIYGSYWDVEEPNGFIDFNLERQCLTLKSTFGMSDDADTGSSVKIDVVGDGTNLYSGTFGLLESHPKSIDLHGVFRLAFQYEALTEAKAVPAVGSPRVLCGF